MKRSRILVEEGTLFISLLKWSILASCIGALIGITVTGFLSLITFSEIYFYQYKLYWLLPVGFFLSCLSVKYLAPEAEGHGTEKVIEAIHKRLGKISARVIPVKLLATLLTIVVGGSVGKEGPSAQIGAGISSLVSDRLHLSDQDRKKLVICGISAGFAVVFGAPISGAIFGVEVLFLGHIMYDTLYPSFLSGIVAFYVAEHLGLSYYRHNVLLVTTSNFFWLQVICSGFFFGIIGLLFIESLKFFENRFARIKIWAPYKGLIGGSLILLFSFVISGDYLGIGAVQIENALSGDEIPYLGFLWKMLFTSITLSSGGSGGVLTPIFFIGSYSGNLFGHIFGADPATFAAIGFVALLAACANTPIAAIVMAGEVFGSEISVWAALASVVSFLIVGYRSVYPSQILVSIKSPSLAVKLGHEIKYTDDLHLSPRKHTISWQLIRLSRKIRKKYKNHE